MRGRKLKEVRNHAGVSAQNLADTIGVSVATVFRWESGEQSPPLDKAHAIAEACGVSLDDLVDAAA